MKFFHISDIHIGKRVCGFSMLEDQRFILEQMLALVREHRPDGVLIAGDLYDKPVPSAEAVELADWFLSELAALQLPVWTISGNHDSAERIAYGGRMLERSGIFMSQVFDGSLQRYTLEKDRTGSLRVYAYRDGQAERVFESEARTAFGEREGREPVELADVYLLPFLRPALARRFFLERVIDTTQQAVEAALEGAPMESDRPNLLMMHQFLTGAAVCDSEELSVGGSDQVDASVTGGFDYVALGHLHGPQRVGRDTVRYSGSPLKYSFSEAGHRKSVTVVEICRKTEEEAPAKPDAAALEEQTPINAGGLAQAGGKGPMPEGPEEQPLYEVESGVGKQADIRAEEESGINPERREWRIDVSTIPLVPLHDLRRIRGPIAALLDPEVYSSGGSTEDYLQVTLTDDEAVLDAIGRLRSVYPNIMRLDFEKGESGMIVEDEILLEEKTAQELFEEFFEKQNGRQMSMEQKKIAEAVWRKGGEGE